MTPIIEVEGALKPELIVDFQFSKSVSEIYKAWSDAELFGKWFCPTGFEVTVCEVKFEIGGYFRVHMQAPDGLIHPTKGEYVSFIENESIVYKDSWDDERPNNEQITSQVIFKSNDKGCLIELYACFPSEEKRQEILGYGVADGWRMFFNNLEKL
jgi:uncharacterized protein YndB with AHSA1/START domain